MTPHQAKSYLESFINYESKLHALTQNAFTLEPVRKLLELINHPQKQFRVIHVAGSKAKGSTAAMIATILDQAGYKVGLYTSPHLWDLRERIRILQYPYRSVNKRDLFCDAISENDFAKIILEIKNVIQKKYKGRPLTYFEILTVLALQYFAQKKVDVVVLETGLGGRLDATNVVESEICVLTPIGLEHTKILGKTIRKIAEEKAGIIKSSYQKVIVAPQIADAKWVIHRRCKYFDIKPIDVRANHLLNVGLLGSHQKQNASVAIRTVEVFGGKQFSQMSKAIKRGLKYIYWPGRFEIVRFSPVIVLDGAHSPASARILVDAIKEKFPNRRINLIVGLSKDKDIKAICQELSKIATMVIATKINHSRAYDFSDKELKRLFPKSQTFITNNLKEALVKVLDESQKRDVILITGSLFLVGQASRLFANEFKG